MKPRRTDASDTVFRLAGGNEDNDLWVERNVDDDGNPCICSTWELTDEELIEIAFGGTITLVVWGTATPPVSLSVGPPLEALRRGKAA